MSKDNLKEFLYNEDLRSVLTFDRDPKDGFYKMTFEDMNQEMRRVFPKMCMEVA